MNSSRNRKVAYVLGIVLVFTLLIGVSNYLSSAADANRLTQKSLGKVDPVSGTAQLVLVGMRGFAVTILWYEAIELKKAERYFELRPIYESICLLQPNFVSPWKFQAWNMAYNIAAEWESVSDKYYWIKEGINFMKNACENNKDIPDLEWYTGFIYQNKFGVSDEKLYLRELLKRDDDKLFAAARNGEQDNFELAYDWFKRSTETVERTNKPAKGMGMTPFMSQPAIAKTYFATFLGEDGKFGQSTRDAWRTAHEEWLSFGRKGGTQRGVDILYKIEYEGDEWNALTDEQKYWAQHYAKIVNYFYWKRRTKAEATDEMQQGREAVYYATKNLKDGRYIEAMELFEKAFPVWEKILKREVDLRNDDQMQDDVHKWVDQYRKLLARIELPNKPVPKKLPLEELLGGPARPPAPPQTPGQRRDLDPAPGGKNPDPPTTVIPKPTN